MASDHSASRRINKELTDILREIESRDKTLACIRIQPTNNILEWNAKIIAPQDSIYHEGVFDLKITFPNDYPFRPPKIAFVTQIYHPNINQSGVICLDILREQWSPALTMQKVMISIVSFLDEPNPEDPMVPEAARLFVKAKDDYKKKVKDYVQKYAVGNSPEFK